MRLLFKTILVFLFLGLTYRYTQAQAVLQIDTTNRCIYSGKIFGEQLYRFDSSDLVLGKIRRIAEVMQSPRNFEPIHTNVSSVAAVTTGAKRYLLYNQEFFHTYMEDNLYTFAILAHEIGHLSNSRHSLTGKFRNGEETEADIFMGRTLQRLGFSLEQSESIADYPGFSYTVPANIRKQQIRRGWELENAYLKSEENAGFLGQEEVVKNLPIPRFPWPPPGCGTAKVLESSAMAGCSTLGQADARLCKGLDAKGFGKRSYFIVPNGFALVTQLEHYNANGTSAPADQRWLDYPLQESFSDQIKYIEENLEVTPPGYFRIFVFIVTDKEFASSPQISGDEAKKWLLSGGTSLPEDLADDNYTARHHVTAIVYKFEAKKGASRLVNRCPGKAAADHLVSSGLNAVIRK
ncbi:MAG: hypothetical protein KA165_04695 [Saprospiraceae bacterium]|nr:hypothetical protein [Saprospiraceae bacterium]